MIILTLRTDKPESEIGLYEDQKQMAYEKWEAHRELAETLHDKIATVLQSVGRDWHDIAGIVVFRGPGSFTGLRIGLSTMNALAYSLTCPIVAVGNEDWLLTGINQLLEGQSDQVALPEYGAPVHITQQKK